MSDPIYEYSDFKVDTPRVDDGWYLVKNGITYEVDIPIDKMRFTKSVNLLTGEVHYPTNADRIRSLSDEELAKWMKLMICKYRSCWNCPMSDWCTPGRGIAEWLEAPADKEGEG